MTIQQALIELAFIIVPLLLIQLLSSARKES